MQKCAHFLLQNFSFSAKIDFAETSTKDEEFQEEMHKNAEFVAEQKIFMNNADF